MLQINCKMCNESFGPIGQRNQPRVIPCGHSFCEFCINERTTVDIQSFECPVCFSRHEAINIRFPPVNHLYYQMMAEFNDFIKRKDWEQQYNKDDQGSQKDDKTEVAKQYKCLYPFCHRLRYEKDGVKQVFCSAKCMELNEELYS